MKSNVKSAQEPIVKPIVKPRIYVTRQLPEIALNKLNEIFDVSLNKEDRVLSKNEIIQNVKDKDALLCLLTDTIDKDVFAAGTKLKVVSNYAVGYNNIDIAEATKRKIPVCITPGILTNAVADLTWALILTVARQVVESHQYTVEGHFTGWAPNLFLGLDLFGKTIGIVGMGRIGEAVAKRAEGFGMNILYTARSGKKLEYGTQVSLHELLQTSDIISLHTPLTPETQHLIGKDELKLMKKSAILINTTRGPVIDEKALVQALQKNEIYGAGLDVYEEEPKLAAGLKDLKNVVLLPHIGSATFETRTKMAVFAVENVLAIFNHTRPHAIVNPEVLA